ncbi:MAG: hypothetical protein Q9157_000865 [Trypethelium eluteriae]
MPTPPQKVLDSRKNMAEDALRRALEKGTTFQDLYDIRRCLQDSAQESGLPNEFFEVLQDKDYANLYIKLTSRRGFTPPTGPSLGTGAITPPRSASGLDQFELPHASLSKGEEFHKRGKEGFIPPTYDESANPYNVKVHHPSRDHIEMVTASRCKEEESFISDKVLARNNLSLHLDRDNTIKLTWKELSETSAKTRRTKFRRISDKDIRNDIAIGQNLDNCGDDESSISDSMQQLALGVSPSFCSTEWKLMRAKSTTEDQLSRRRPCLQK